MQKPYYKVIILLIVLLVVFSNSSNRVNLLAQNSPVKLDKKAEKAINLDFEEGEIGQLPTGWVSPTKAFGYDAKLVVDTVKHGKQSVVLFTDQTTNPNGFGNVMQAVDATAFRGKRIKFRAAVKSDIGSKAQLWLRVDRVNQQAGFFDNMQDRPIISSIWGYYDIIADIDEDAETINFGMILTSKGKAWLDNASIEEIGTLTYLKEPAKPLTEQALANVSSFTKLFGYVRHFHPSDEAANTNWEALAVKGIKIIEDAKNNAELMEKLTTLFQPIAPTIRIFPSGQQPSLPIELTKTNTSKITYWKHQGFGAETKSSNSAYKSERVQQALSDKTPNPNKPFIGDLGQGISCLIPVALYLDGEKTIPHTENKQTIKEELIKYSGNDRSTRLANVILIWNIAQHFYPYFDVVKVNWEESLKKALKSAAEDKTAKEFTKTLKLMIADLQDGHGNVTHPEEQAYYSVPIVLDWIDGKLVITKVEPSLADKNLAPSDVIVKIDGRSSAEVLAEKEALISSATPQWKRFRAVSSLLTGLKDTESTLEIETRSGEKKAVTLKRTMFFYELQEQKPEKVAEIKPGIFYLDLDRISDGDFMATLPKLEKAKGIVFDLRGYPRQISPIVLSYLTDKPIQSARWNIPMVSTPDHKDMLNFNTDGRWMLEPKKPKLAAKIAFLTDGRAISYAESYLGIVEAYKLAEIVGAPTAGTNGNINIIKLLGDYQVIWTGMKVLKHDGSQHHGVGIQPTIAVSRTIEGVAQKKDEVLEKAIEVLSK
ncbi:MAG: hypothetical protein IPK14_13155 [Blastocatellia bacterium]|nr:hypothetical protein [Blastocatellia bacterium]